MDIQNRLKRSAVTIAVSKALDSMKSDTKRSSRNLLDLGLLFSKDPQQRLFFEKARQVLNEPKNTYYQLIRSMIDNVNPETIKTVGINLGFNSLTYGTKQLQKMQASLGHYLPWMLAFLDLNQSQDFFNRISTYITQAQELGIFCYLFIINNYDSLYKFITIAQQQLDCAFLLNTTGRLVNTESATLLSKLNNVVISLALDEKLFFENSIEQALRLLHGKKCLYGVHLNYNQENYSKVLNTSFLQQALALGCTFVTYNIGYLAEQAGKSQLYSFIKSVRESKEPQPIIVMDWQHDTEEISKYVGEGSDFLVLSSNGQVRCGRSDKHYLLQGSLTITDIIKMAMPCYP